MKSTYKINKENLKLTTLGFTLIELVAVLVIMAILALIVTPLVMNIIRKAKDAANKRSIDAYGRSVELAIATHLLDTGTFPTNLQSLTVEYTGKTVSCNIMQMKENGGLYMSECTVGNKEVHDDTDDGWYHYGTIEEEPKSAALELLEKANLVTVTNYTDGNMHEMYTFSHPATIQTEALTDYRYIGANPNNYVTFNNELWRIIGVFTVEDENGNFEQRIKIVRNDKLSDDMAWDSNRVNEWATASLKNYLNGDYYNNLTSDAKSMIADTKYYLGGFGTYNDGAAEYYEWERGTTVYQGRSTSWIGKIGLMYPSDYFYTYALGVDNNCFASGSYSVCPNSSGKNNSWTYRVLDNSNEWLITPVRSTDLNSCMIFSEGWISYFDNYAAGRLTTSYGVYPALYLDNQVKISSGDGSEDNPYQLSL